MKRIIAIALMIGAGYFAMATPADAFVRTPRIGARQEKQHDRIQQGVRSDELTRGEAARLRAGEAKIQADKLAAKSDGNVSPAERAQLNRELNRESHAIYRMKHNAHERH